eukprot:gene41213-50842_t
MPPAVAPDVTRTVKPGTTAPVAWSSIYTHDCRPGPLPTLTIVSPPSHGTATVVVGSGTGGKDGVCAGQPLKLREVLYRPVDGFSGVDTLTVGVAHETFIGGRVIGAEDIHVTINVPASTGPIEKKAARKPHVLDGGSRGAGFLERAGQPMSQNSFGHLFRVTTWGESHGPALGCV